LGYGTIDSVNSRVLQLVIGEFLNGSIKNMQLGFYLKYKGSDPGNKVVPVGTIRIFEDKDGLQARKHFRL
jgi:hypothetical protein